MKEFDWKLFSENTNNKKYFWFALNYKKVVSENEFVKAMKGLKKHSHSKSLRRRYKNYKEYSLRRKYRYFKERFDFFNGNNNL